MTERWLPIVGFEGRYEVSDLGRVRSLPRYYAGGRILKRAMSKGYPKVALHCNGTRYDIRVHVLVLATFVGPRPEGMEALHDNDIRSDARLVNLSWGTHSANADDYVRNGKHYNANKTRCARNHEYTPENTGIGKRGNGRTFRVCKACRRQLDATRRRSVA